MKLARDEDRPGEVRVKAKELDSPVSHTHPWTKPRAMVIKVSVSQLLDAKRAASILWAYLPGGP